MWAHLVYLPIIIHEGVYVVVLSEDASQCTIVCLFLVIHVGALSVPPYDYS